MDYADANIISKLIKAKRRSVNLSDTVKIGEMTYSFSLQEPIGDKLQMILPDELQEMPPTVARDKYPSENRPSIIWTIPDGTVNFMFTPTDTDISFDRYEQTARGFRAVLKRVYPANTFLELDVKKMGENEVPIGCFDYISFAVDSDIYNMFYITELEHKMMVGGFNCLSEHKNEWKPLLMLMFQSIRDLIGKEEVI